METTDLPRQLRVLNLCIENAFRRHSYPCHAEAYKEIIDAFLAPPQNPGSNVSENINRRAALVRRLCMISAEPRDSRVLVCEVFSPQQGSKLQKILQESPNIFTSISTYFSRLLDV